MSTQMRYIFLADGKLYVGSTQSQPEEVESKFVQEALDRRQMESDRNSWKSSGMMWNFKERYNPNPFAIEERYDDLRPVRFVSVTGAGRSGEVYYSLVNGTMGGLFHYNITENYERRLVHRQHMLLRDLCRSDVNSRLACSVSQMDGSANLALMEGDGGKLREITAGDSVDEAPTWIPDQAETLVFQSAGVGRYEHGGIFGYAPYAIHRLDIANDRMTTLAESEEYDYLAPRGSVDGAIYYIRRPYELHPRKSPLHSIGDVVLFPFRLARAFVHFFNVFSMMFSKKPLITAGGPRKEGPDRRAMMLWGRYVEVDKQLRGNGGDGDRPLVPRDWCLIRKTPDGQEQIIAHSVIAYDLADEGAVVYTNGTGIYHQDRGGKVKRLARSRFIQTVVALSGDDGGLSAGESHRLNSAEVAD